MTDLPPEVLAHPLREESAWVALRDSGVTPRDASPMLTTQTARDEFLTGVWLLNATTRTGLLNSVTPQMLKAVDVLEYARDNQTLISAVLMPRRSGKTTVVLCLLLGRCYLQPVHYAGFTLLTTQKKTSERYRLDVYGPIIRQWPDEDTRPVKVIRSNGNERVEFPNGSNLAVLSPEGDAIRSGAYDTLLLDEGGEASPERWADVIGAVIPSFDTRPDGQLILAGTAGDYRAGSTFWDTLNDDNAGRLNYSLHDDIDPAELEAWEPDEDHPEARAGELVAAMHPGIGTLTTLDRIANNYKFLGVEKFTREYFNVFGAEGSNVALIPAPLWAASALPLTVATRPDLSSVCLFVHPDALYASVVQAWKDSDGRIHVGLLHHQAGVKGLASQVLMLARSTNRPIVFDTASAATANVMQEMREARPAPQERPMISVDVRRAAVRFMTTLREDNLRHHDQQELNAAAEIAVKRAWGTGAGWGFGRPDPKRRPQDDITPIEAAALAVYALDSEVAYRSPLEDFAAA